MSAEPFVGDGAEGGTIERREISLDDPEVRSRVLSFLGYSVYRDIEWRLEYDIMHQHTRRTVTLVRWARLPYSAWRRSAA